MKTKIKADNTPAFIPFNKPFIPYKKNLPQPSTTFHNLSIISSNFISQSAKNHCPIQNYET